MKKVLVLCTGNSCRSQMAHGWLSQFVGDEAVIFSAGVETHGLNAKAVQYMAEAGVDIAHHKSNLVDEYAEIDFDFVITVCDHAQEKCPVFPSSAKTFHHNFSDPSKVVGTEDELATAYRKCVSEIKVYCEEFVNKHL